MADSSKPEVAQVGGNQVGKLSESIVRDAYKKIFDWNWMHWGDVEYEPANPEWFYPIFNAIEDDIDELPEWLESYVGFCPDCGFMGARTSENMSSYPEQWIKTVCQNCQFLLGTVDNSPYVSWWQYKDNKWRIEI